MQIEKEQFQHTNFNSRYLHEYSTKFNSKSISRLSIQRSTLTWQKNGELRSSKNLPLEEKYEQTSNSRPGKLQNHSYIDVMKLCTWIEAWNYLDLAQIRISIVMFLSFMCLILHQILQIKAWSILNEDQRTQICKKITSLCGEILNYGGEKFWRESLNLDLEWWIVRNSVRISLLYACLITLLITLRHG